MFKGLVAGISRTRNNLLGGLKAALGKKELVDSVAIEALESALLMADCGIEATQEIIAGVERLYPASNRNFTATVIDQMTALLARCEAPLTVSPPTQGPFVILVVGVNGAGKTTTIAKIGRRLNLHHTKYRWRQVNQANLTADSATCQARYAHQERHVENFVEQ